MTCNCNKQSDKNYSTFGSVAKDYIYSSNQPRKLTLRNLPKATLINSVYNGDVWGDEFMMSLAWNNENDYETGCAKSHLFPPEIIGWNPKDTLVRKEIPCQPGVTWERQNGYLIVRDETIDGDEDELYEKGGQIVMKLSSTIPANAVSDGYSALDLTNLGVAIGNYIDNETIIRDPNNNNKLTCSLTNGNLYADEDSITKVFQKNEVNDKYYYNNGSLDNKVRIKTDGSTVFGDGVDVPLSTAVDGITNKYQSHKFVLNSNVDKNLELIINQLENHKSVLVGTAKVPFQAPEGYKWVVDIKSHCTLTSESTGSFIITFTPIVNNNSTTITGIPEEETKFIYNDNGTYKDKLNFNSTFEAPSGTIQFDNKIKVEFKTMTGAQTFQITNNVITGEFKLVKIN